MKHSKLSIATIVLGFLFFPAAIITGLIDILKGSKEERHILTYIGLIIAALMLIIGVANYKPGSQKDSAEANTSIEATAATEDPEAEPILKAEVVEHPMPDNVDITLAKTVNDDVTGNWRLARVATSAFVTDYAVAYYENYFESDDEIHVIVNFSTKTTSIVKKVANILDITVHEYVDKEEHSAKTIGGGTIYGEYHVHLDTGEVEELDLSSDE